MSDKAKQQETADALYKQVQRRLVATLLYDSTSANRVLEIVTTEDIEEPALELIFNAILDITRRNEIISPVSIAQQLEIQGNLAKAGGPSTLYLLRDEGRSYLLEAPPELYAQMVKESSAKSKLTRIISEHKDTFKNDSGIAAADGISDLQTALNGELYKLSDESTSSALAEDYDYYLNLLDERQKVAEANVGAAEGLQGIPSLLPSINQYTTGWLPGQLITIGARTGVGKALALDTPIPTPSGWTTMGKLKVGDLVLGRDGKPTRVTNATKVQNNRRCYKVIFHNGASIIADADHLWLTETYHSRRYSLPEEERTTKEILNTLRINKDLRKNHSIKVSSAIELPETELPIDPYLLGYWLGNGHSWNNNISVYKTDYESLAQKIEQAGYSHTVNNKENTYNVCFSQFPIKRDGDMKKKLSIKATLRELSLLENKHIPTLYLRSSINQRRELLAGLLDSDGSCSRKNGRVEFGVTRKVLADGFAELARSLGLVILRTEKTVKGKTEASSIGYNIEFKADFNPFFLSRKAEIFNERTVRNTNFYISDIEPVESVPVRCIEVDNADHVYLAGESMIPTHNSVFAVNSSVAAAQAGKSVLFFSLEMGDAELKDRIISSTTGILLNHLKQGNLSPEDRELLKATEEDIRAMKIKIETEARVTVDSIRAKALRQAQSPEGLDFIVIDYLQLITPTGRVNSRQEAVAEMSRNVKLLAKQLGVPIMVLVQVNREGKDDENPIPKLSQIRESGAIAQDSDIVILLHRDETMDDTIPQTLVLLEKNRNGEAQKTIRCHSNLECSLFREVIRARDVERHTEADQESFIEDELDDLRHLSSDSDDFEFNSEEDVF